MFVVNFSDTYHIQGCANAGIRLGPATGDGDLVAFITFRASNDVDWELVRYATSARVRVDSLLESL